MFDFIRKKRIEDRAADEILYEYVLNEMEKGITVKGLWAKAMANSDGIETKTQSIYMKYRVQSIKDAFTMLQINYNTYSKNQLFNYIKNELFGNVKKIEEERAETEEEKKQRKEQERFDKDELYQSLVWVNPKRILELYQKEIEDLGYREASFFSRYSFKKDGNAYYAQIKSKDKKLIIYKGGSKSPETTFNLEDKADEIIALNK